MPGDTPFRILVEVVPPPHGNPENLLDKLDALQGLPISAFNVASNPVAKPHLSALVLSGLIQQRTGIPALPHFTTRDHNRLSLISSLWGAKALGMKEVLVTTGDFPPPDIPGAVHPVADLSVFELLSLAVQENLRPGVVLGIPRSSDDFQAQMKRLAKKLQRGAEFVITQPVYTPDRIETLLHAAQEIPIPIYPGILPLRSANHGHYMDHNVRGIHVPESLLAELESAAEPGGIGLKNAADMLKIIRRNFPGVCLMPPFQQYNLIHELV